MAGGGTFPGPNVCQFAPRSESLPISMAARLVCSVNHHLLRHFWSSEPSRRHRSVCAHLQPQVQKPGAPEEERAPSWVMK